MAVSVMPLIAIIFFMSEITIGKSAARQWREYHRKGGSLPFNPWLNREKEKIGADGEATNNLILVDRNLNDSVHQTIKETNEQVIGLNPKPSGDTIFGIKKPVFIAGSVLFTAGLTYLIIQLAKK